MSDYEARQAANDRSLNDAEHHRQLWSAEEDDLIRETMDEPLEDVAYVLGRSIFATDMRRSIVRHNAQAARASFDRTRQARVEPIENRAPVCSRCTSRHYGEC